MPDQPTLKDIARKLGLSVPAVSQGLRNVGNISQATCKRIQAAARQMGYRPNPLAAALRQGAHKSSLQHGVPLAILRMPLQFGGVDKEAATPKGPPLYPVAPIVQGIVRRATELGYRAETFAMQSPRELSRQLKVLYAQGFQGIFLPAIGAAHLTDINWNAFSVMACGRYDQPSPFHSVRQEIFEASRFLYNWAILRGYRRICVVLINHKPKILDDYAREAAAQACRLPDGGKLHVLVIERGQSPVDLAAVVRKEKIDAVIGFSVSYYYELKEAGIKIPEEVGFAALHVSGNAGQCISGLVQPSDYEGVVAANRMDAMIRHRERGIPPIQEQIVVQNPWWEGSTLPDRNLA